MSQTQRNINLQILSHLSLLATFMGIYACKSRNDLIIKSKISGSGEADVLTSYKPELPCGVEKKDSGSCGTRQVNNGSCAEALKNKDRIGGMKNLIGMNSNFLAVPNSIYNNSHNQCFKCVNLNIDGNIHKFQIVDVCLTCGNGSFDLGSGAMRGITGNELDLIRKPRWSWDGQFVGCAGGNVPYPQDYNFDYNADFHAFQAMPDTTMIVANGSAIEPLANSPGSNSGCNYANAARNNGWGWDAAAGSGAGCPPLNGGVTPGVTPGGNPQGGCSYADAAKYNGWGWDAAAGSGAGCPPK
ncbi:MAG: hypothetical protein HQK54_14280 [Oligoflexales bacterium]|nr:hypothetical protein [Oligoflexales bacterium]